MVENYEFHYGEEMMQNSPKWDEIKDSGEESRKHHVLDEVITVLRALVNIFDIISSNFNRKY